ncbi:unnamed protein product [Closterium sp. NIES-54]
MQPPERNYPVHDKEMLAIVHAFRVWRCYLTGADVTIRTDHKSLQYLRSQPTLDPRQIRWLDYLESNFNYTVTYKKGANNIADALTRPSMQIAAVLVARTNPVLTGLFTHGYTIDMFFKTLHQRATTPHGKYYLKAGTNRIWVPAYQPLRELLTQEVHDSNLSGHFVIEKKLKLLQGNYYRPDMLTDVQRYVTTCPTCQAIKSSRQRPARLLQHLEPPERPWQQVTMDFVTGLPAGASGNDSALVVVDRLTKMAHFAPCRTTITAEQTYGTRLQFSSSYHPQTDGQTKRTNQTMEELIRTNCPDLTKWEDSLPMLEYGFGELTQATATWLQTTHLQHVLTSPFVGISIDESTDRCSGKHLILFITFVRDFKVVTEFMALLTVEKADAASLLGVLLSHLLAVGVDLQRIAGISTDGANVMMGCKDGLTTCLRVRIPHLVSSHCIAHREALAAKTAASKIPAFNVIDTVIRTVAEHLGRMLRLVAVLPALIVVLKEWDATLYALVTSYMLHFLLFFIADVLEQHNILNRAFQHKELDYASVHAQIKRTTSHIESRYVDCGDDFGGDVSELLPPFIERHGPGGNREVKVEGIDSDGRPTRFKFVPHEDELEEFEGPGIHDGCVGVCTEFAEVIVHQLEHRLGDLNGMSGARLFTPDEYPLERGERNRRCLEWLQTLVTLLPRCIVCIACRFNECLNLGSELAPPVLLPIPSGNSKRRAEKELRMFTSVLAASTKGERGFHAGLTAMLKTPNWRENYPDLVLLWLAVAVLPLSTVECERGFSRHNIIKSWKRGALKDARLGDLMCMSLMDYAPDWDDIVTFWRSYKKRKPQSNAPLPPAGKQHNKKGREADEEMDVVDLEDEQALVDSDDDD